ncbi:MAG: hypothetical protein E6J20_17780 [Chloroflexi bacterium]|nr:MAG: hypothetical protein E6J20_17780 [Chloroflexota bacterium]
MEPETRYARSGEVSIAYQVVGEGPFDLVYVPGFVSNVELRWRVQPLLSGLGDGRGLRFRLHPRRGSTRRQARTHHQPLQQNVHSWRAVCDFLSAVQADEPLSPRARESFGRP